MKRTALLRRTPLKRTDSLRRSRRKRPAEGPLTPSEWRIAVARSGNALLMPPISMPVRLEAHHWLPKDELRKRRLWGCVWDARNGSMVDPRTHQEHEHSGRLIPRSAIPQSAWEFAREIDAESDEPWAVAYLERHYPQAASGGATGSNSAGPTKERDTDG